MVYLLSKDFDHKGIVFLNKFHLIVQYDWYHSLIYVLSSLVDSDVLHVLDAHGRCGQDMYLLAYPDNSPFLESPES
jgi:hypothetical protein